MPPALQLHKRLPAEKEVTNGMDFLRQTINTPSRQAMAPIPHKQQEGGGNGCREIDVPVSSSCWLESHLVDLSSPTFVLTAVKTLKKSGIDLVKAHRLQSRHVFY